MYSPLQKNPRKDTGRTIVRFKDNVENARKELINLGYSILDGFDRYLLLDCQFKLNKEKLKSTNLFELICPEAELTSA